MKKVFGDQVEKASVCDRHVNSPCVFTTSEYGWSANLERIRKRELCTQNHLTGRAHTHIFLVRTPQRIIRTFPVWHTTLAQGEIESASFSESHIHLNL